MKHAYPPLNAPTGFLTVGATTTCSSSDRDVWNDLEAVCGLRVSMRDAEAARGARILEAMIYVRLTRKYLEESKWFLSCESVVIVGIRVDVAEYNELDVVACG